MRRNRTQLPMKKIEHIVASLESESLSTCEFVNIALEAFELHQQGLQHPSRNSYADINVAIEKAKEDELNIKKAIKHPGAFHEWCVEHGFDKVTPECIELGLKDKDPEVRKRANFAKVLLELQKKRKNKKKKQNKR